VRATRTIASWRCGIPSRHHHRPSPPLAILSTATRAVLFCLIYQRHTRRQRTRVNATHSRDANRNVAPTFYRGRRGARDDDARTSSAGAITRRRFFWITPTISLPCLCWDLHAAASCGSRAGSGNANSARLLHFMIHSRHVTYRTRVALPLTIHAVHWRRVRRLYLASQAYRLGAGKLTDIH